MKTMLLAAAALAASLGAAVAADLPVGMPMKAPPPVHVMSWTGCYLGAGGGYAMWNQDNTVIDATGAIATPRTTAGGRGWFGTVQGGCDYQFAERWVIGAFGDYDFARIQGQLGTLGLGLIGRERLTSAWAAGGRLGYVIMPQLLGFVSAGYTQAHFNRVDFTGVATMASQDYSGFFIGSGYEYSLAWLLPGLFWKTEYRFSSFDRANNPLFTPAGVPFGFSVDSTKYSQQIRSEIVWRFF